MTPVGRSRRQPASIDDQAGRRILTPQEARTSTTQRHRRSIRRASSAGKPAAVLHLLLGSDEPGRSVSPHQAARRRRASRWMHRSWSWTKSSGHPTASGSRCCSTRAGSSAGSSRARSSGRSWKRASRIRWSSIATGPTRRGNSLKAGFRKTFRAGPPDETSPDPKGLDDRLTPGQHARSAGSSLSRTTRPGAARSPDLCRNMPRRRSCPARSRWPRLRPTWRFTPVSPWRTGTYRLVVGTELEDVAGNSVARPFEVDVTGPISGRVTTKTVALPFRIAPRPLSSSDSRVARSASVAQPVVEIRWA